MVEATNCVLNVPFTVSFMNKPVRIVSIQGQRITLRLPPGVKGTQNLNFEINNQGTTVNVRSAQKLYVR